MQGCDKRRRQSRRTWAALPEPTPRPSPSPSNQNRGEQAQAHRSPSPCPACPCSLSPTSTPSHPLQPAKPLSIFNESNGEQIRKEEVRCAQRTCESKSVSFAGGDGGDLPGVVRRCSGFDSGHGGSDGKTGRGVWCPNRQSLLLL